MLITNTVCLALLCVGVIKAATLEAETQSSPAIQATTAETSATFAASAADAIVASTTSASATSSAPIISSAATTSTYETSATKKPEALVNRITTFVPILNAEGSENLTKIAAGPIKKKTRYDGDKVFRVFTVNSKHRKKIKEIERDGSEYDIFIRRVNFTLD